MISNETLFGYGTAKTDSTSNCFKCFRKPFSCLRIIKTFVFVLLTFIISLSFAMAVEVSEDKIKVVSLYKIIPFVRWPEQVFENRDTITVGVLDEASSGEAFNLINDRPLGKRKIVVKRISDLTEIDDCQVLFISGAKGHRINEVIQQVCRSPVLTIGDQKAFTKAGGIIRFYFKAQKIRFKINISAARQASLKISSKLLELSEVIE